MNPSQKASSRERVGSRENLGFREKTIIAKEQRPWIEGILGSPAIGKGPQSWGGRLFQNSLVQGPCFLSRWMIKAFPSQHIDILRTFLIPYQDPTAMSMRPSGGEGYISLLWVWLLWAKHWKTSFWGAWGAHPRPYLDSTVSGAQGGTVHYIWHWWHPIDPHLYQVGTPMFLLWFSDLLVLAFILFTP